MKLFYLCLSKDLNPGEYKTFRYRSTEWVLARKENGQLKLARNICRHRGFPVAEKCGKLPIKCPYHGLIFNFEQSMFAFDTCGFIFSCRDDMNIIKTTDLKHVENLVGQEFATIQMNVKAPAVLWMQNTADIHHLKFVHPHFSQQFESDTPVWIDPEPPSAHALKVKSSIAERYNKFLTGDPAIFKDVFVHILIANLSITSFLGIFFSIETAIPTTDGCQVTTRFFTSKVANVPDKLIQLAKTANARILEEDKEIVERWARGFDPDEPSAWLPGEERIRSYLEDLK